MVLNSPFLSFPPGFCSRAILIYFLKILRSPNTPSSPVMIRIRLLGSGAGASVMSAMVAGSAKLAKTLTGKMAKAETIRNDSVFMGYPRSDNLTYCIFVVLRRNLSAYPNLIRISTISLFLEKNPPAGEKLKL